MVIISLIIIPLRLGLLFAQGFFELASTDRINIVTLRRIQRLPTLLYSPKVYTYRRHK